MSFKTAMSNVGYGLLTATGAVLTAANNGPLQERIDEIDAEITKLQEERESLVNRLI